MSPNCKIKYKKPHDSVPGDETVVVLIKHKTHEVSRRGVHPASPTGRGSGGVGGRRGKGAYPSFGASEG
eukprot:526771-Rhodomonas_salina.1